MYDIDSKWDGKNDYKTVKHSFFSQVNCVCEWTHDYIATPVIVATCNLVHAQK